MGFKTEQSEIPVYYATPEQCTAARAFVAAHAHDADDAALLLKQLGLMPGE